MPYRIAIALLLALLAGCITRTALYAPRRDNTEAHRAAESTADCLGCHATGDLPPHHSAKNDCFRCHKLCKEY